MSDELQRVQLTNSLHLWQRRRGLRVGTDDVLAAWSAATACPSARHVLELGCGHGAVTLMLAEALPKAHLLSIEAQRISHDLLKRNVSEAQLAGRIETILGDLRTTDAMEGRRFELVTGTPPFMPVGSGTLPSDAQRAAARFELRGGIEAYCAIAARHLEPQGVVSLVMDAERPERYERAIAEVGLHLTRVTTVLARTEGPPRYLIYQARRDASDIQRTRLAVRDHSGAWSPEFEVIRRRLGLPGA